MIRIGNFEVRSVVTAHYRLDGGAMFGVVPKVLWEKSEGVDSQNRIAMVMRTLLAVDRANRRAVLVDTGAGDKWPAKEATRFAIDPHPTALADALAEFGLTDDEVTDVVITHLHFDHAGGMTIWDTAAPGEATASASNPSHTRLRFCNARHWVHRTHWEHALAPSQRDRASFLPRDFDALRDSDRLRIVEGQSPPPPGDGIEWFVSNGHTPGQLLPIFHDGDNRLLFVGDLIPTSTHLPAPWVMAYDLHPLVSVEEKQKVLRRCADEGMMLAFPHDQRMGGANVNLAGKHPSATPVGL